MRKIILFVLVLLCVRGYSISKKYELNLEDNISLITWADIASDGSCYVLDGRDGIILKLGKHGKLVLKKKAKGQGPGEFQYPTCIQCLKSGDVLVADILVRKMTLLDDELKFKENHGVPVFPLFAKYTDNYLYVMTDALQNNRYFFRVVRIENGKNPKLEIVFEGNKKDIVKMKKETNMDDPGLVFFDTNGKVFAAAKQVANELMLYYSTDCSKLNPLKKIRLPYTPIQLTGKEKENAIENSYLVAKHVSPLIPKGIFKVSKKIALKYFSLDSQGNVWLLVATDKPEVFRLIEVDLRERKIVSSLELKGFKDPAINISEEWLLIFEKNEFVEPKIRLYQIHN